MPIELHCHSTASDGDLSPTQLVDRALALGLTTLCLTDHDTVDGVEEAKAAARETSLRVLTGVELSCHHQGREIHLLGYLFEHRDPDFLELLEHMKAERRERVAEMIKKLSALDIDISYEQVEQQATGGSIGRPHVARALVESGQVETVSEAFDLYIGNRAAGYVGRRLLSLSEGIEAIHKAGGCSVLAHPGVLRDWPLVEELMQLPLVGVEVWHPSHNKQARKRAKKLGGRYQKVLTGGSDFHRAKGDYHELGSASVTEKVVDRLMSFSGAAGQLV